MTKTQTLRSSSAFLLLTVLILNLNKLNFANPASASPLAPDSSISPQIQQQSTTQGPPANGISKQQVFSNNEPPRRQQQATDDEYLVGVGIADITGPSADINLMGYAKPNQDAGGIHLRQFSRSIIVEDSNGRRVLYNSIDNGMISQLLRTQVLNRLKLKYGSRMYNESNVMMTASHSHSCPGGFFQYMLYNIPSAGFISQTLDSLVDGIVLSVARAHEQIRGAKIYYNEGELLDASVNRSPTSYRNNPSEERTAYKHDTDKIMYLLKIVDSKTSEPMAMLNWFPVHGTSMNNTNKLISSDNKGYASLLFEKEFNPVGTLPGKGKFVAIFAQANEGDVSPNTLGPRCIDSGLPCEPDSSTCGNPPRNEKCIAFGPGKDMFESTKIIAHKQYRKALELFNDHASMQSIRGPVRFVHEYIDMTKQVVPVYKSAINLSRQKKSLLELNSTYRTCQAGLGYSFAAGTTDGPGAFDFQQGDTVSTRYWNMVRDFLRKPTEAQVKCHHPKPILLSTGEMDFPYMWHPRVVPTQILMFGQFAIVGLPGEFTTMAGRRVRNAVLSSLQNGVSFDYLNVDNDGGDDDDYESELEQGKSLKRNKRAYSLSDKMKVVLSGLSNIYTSYVTTIEEYAVQRYEGASTLYGPHTLQAYINQFRKLATHLVLDEPLPEKDQLQPPDLTKSLFTLKAGVIFDGSQHGHKFGHVLDDVDSNRTYKCLDSVNVSFVAANPRNNLRHEDSFLYVDKYVGNGTWITIASDASWETKFIWERTNTLFGESRATIVWDIPHDCESGIYKIRHFGANKNLLQSISQYSGESSLFKVSSGEHNLLDSQLDELLESARQSELATHDSSSDGNLSRHRSANDRALYPSIYSAFSSLSSWLGLTQH